MEEGRRGEGDQLGFGVLMVVPIMFGLYSFHTSCHDSFHNSHNRKKSALDFYTKV